MRKNYILHSHADRVWLFCSFASGSLHAYRMGPTASEARQRLLVSRSNCSPSAASISRERALSLMAQSNHRFPISALSDSLARARRDSVSPPFICLNSQKFRMRSFLHVSSLSLTPGLSYRRGNLNRHKSTQHFVGRPCHRIHHY